MNAIVLFGAFALSFWTVQAQEIKILTGRGPQTEVSVAQIAGKVRPGQILVLGENHGLKTSRRSQMELLQALRDQGLRVSVGLEFFYYPQQPLVDAFRLGSLTETQFLQEIAWGQPPFDFYRDQAVFPRYQLGEQTMALNAPRALTSKISKVGIAGLEEAEKALLPPHFELGRASYKKRFLSMMPHLPDPATGERYFAAQSVWDDTMAWRASEFIKSHPDQVLAIVVGDFHAQYGGGLPDRIAARSGVAPTVFSFVNIQDLSESEIQDQVKPSPEYGIRADYLWVVVE